MSWLPEDRSLYPNRTSTFRYPAVRWNTIRIYIALLAVPVVACVALFAWVVSYETNKVAQTVSAVVLETSRPLGGSDKAPVDWTGDDKADGWAFGEYLPGDRATVYRDSEGRSFVPLGIRDFTLMGILGVAAMILILTLAGLSLSDWVRSIAWRSVDEDWNRGSRQSPHPQQALPKQWRLGGLLCPYRLTAAVNPGTFRLRLIGLLLSPHDRVAEGAANNPALPRWARRAASRQRRLRSLFIQDEAATPRQLCAYATDRSTSREDLIQIARHRMANADVLRAVADNPNAGLDSLEAVATHPASTTDLAISLMANEPERTDSSYGKHRIQLTMARNSCCPPEPLAWLAEHACDRGVLGSVAQNPNTPPEAAVLAALRAQSPGSSSLLVEPRGNAFESSGN